MYRFDWYMVPEVFSDKVKEETLVTDFIKVLDFFDNSEVKRIGGEFCLSVLRDGVYYGYAYEGQNSIIVQDLPWKWCRSNYKIKGRPAVEFNMEFFDKTFPDLGYRMRVLDLFPPEFKKGYLLYKQHKLPPDINSINGFGIVKDWGSWYLLDPSCAIKFSLFGTNDLPIFINALPEIIDLETAQGIDRQRQLQQLLKIIIQKLPLDKNNDLIFDVDEAKDIHDNAVAMLSRCVGVDVLTTFAEVDSIDVSDANSVAKDNSLENSERTVYQALGLSKNIFNTEGNLALEKSILEDEGTLKNLIYQFESFFNTFATLKSHNPKKWMYKFYLLHTTQYNYQALSKMYKEQTQIGFSKMLPQIALGQSQSFILNTAFFENNMLNLSEIMVPPLMSSTMSIKDLQDLGNSKQTDNNNPDSSTGRPKKDESDLSDKTIQNKESMS